MIEARAGFSPFIQGGIFGLDSVARELAVRVCRVTPAASGLHRKRIVALNGPPCSWRKGGSVSIHFRISRKTGQCGQE